MLGTVGLRLRRHAVPRGRGPRAARPAPGDDDAHRARDRRRVRLQPGRDARATPGCRSGRSSRRSSPSCCSVTGSRCARSRRRRARSKELAKLLPSRGDRGSRATARRRSRSRRCVTGDVVLVRPGRARPGGRRGAVRREQRRRVDDHRRVAPGEEAPRRPGDRRDRERGRVAPRRGDRDRASRPRSPASCAWSSRRRPRARAPRRSPTAPRSCSPSSRSRAAVLTARRLGPRGGARARSSSSAS